ncbi:hypothetical protein V6N13_047390 [Hibiscus sabdariffa]|uniref:C2H2-type domain-containing protein n=1 Tax=Hibiscus sabdariffa TaxID=183260 RepID=A0ABR2F441_9ROSI
MNFSHNNSFSSTGLSLGNGTTGSRFFPSSIDSNFSLISRPVHVHVHVHSVINYVPWPAFPLSEVTPPGTELLRTTRLLSPTSTMGLAFGSSSRFGSSANHENFPTQPHYNQFLNMNHLRSTNPGSVNRSDVRSDANHEIFPTQASDNQFLNMNLLRSTNPDSVNRSDVRSNANHEIFPTQTSDNQFMNIDLLRSTNPGSVNRSDVRSNANHEIFPTQPSDNQFMNIDLLRSTNSGSVNQSDVERETTGLRSDGRIHSLPGYPRGIYQCPKCMTTCYSSQTFAAHVQSAHYSQEDEEERRRRMAARCRRRNLRLRRSSQGLTAVPVSSRGVAKGHAMRRKNGTAVGVDDVHRVGNGVGAAAAMRGPFSAVIKQEPM